MRPAWPLREVVARHYYRLDGAPIGTGRAELTLSCGHIEFRKRSREPQVLARCWACHMADLDDSRQPDEGNTWRCSECGSTVSGAFCPCSHEVMDDEPARA